MRSLSLFDAIVLRQLAVPQPDRLVAVYPGIGEALLGVPLPTLLELRTSQGVVEDVCGYSRGALQVEVGGAVASRTNEGVTGGCYQMLGVGLAACAWPALRAVRIAPAEALRHE